MDLWSYADRSKFSFAIPSEHAIKALVALGPLIEIGAGTGLWAAEIKKAGGDILAYDNYGPGWADMIRGEFFRVRFGDHRKLKWHKGRTLFLCWPPYSESMALDCLLAYKGSILAYIGEGNGGCTGCDDFHDLLEREWEEVDGFDIPQFPGIHDYFCLFERKVA